MSLFNSGDFVLHSGGKSSFLIDCNALSWKDWQALAEWAAKERLPPFGAVEGVPRGGLLFAEALRGHMVNSGVLLIVDDVLSSGKSMEEHRGDREAIGVVLFARGPVPSWVTPLFIMPQGRKKDEA